MLIVYEAPDNCGKSTQIQEIIKHFYPDKLFHVLHYSGTKNKGYTPEEYLKNSKQYYREMFSLFQIAQYNGINLICDRSHLGELVYAQKYRGYSGDYVLDLEKEINLRWSDVFLITFVDTVDNLIAREDGLSFSINREDKQEEINKFISAHERSNIPHKLLINIENLSIKEVTSYIISWLKKENQC